MAHRTHVQGALRLVTPDLFRDNLTNHKDWEEIPCREDEQKQIYDHVLTALELNSSSALCILLLCSFLTYSTFFVADLLNISLTR